MKKLLFLLVLATALLLSACAKKPIETPDIPEIDTPIVEPDKNEENKSELVYEDFEYKITTTDYEALYYMPREEVAKDFLSALALGRTDLLHLYFQYDKEDIYGKAKFDFKLAETDEKIEHIGYHGKVKMTISDSETDIFPNGEYDYTLLVWESNGTPIAYFGPTERLDDYLGENEPSLETNSALYHSHKFVESLMHDFETDVTINAIKEPFNSFNTIYHTTIHTFTSNGKDYIGKATPEEFKGYIRDRFGYTDEEILELFADEFIEDTRTVLGDDGVYSFDCSHGYSSHMYELTSVEREGTLHRLTYTFYADSAHMVPCIVKTFVFEENKDNDIMALVDIENEALNDLVAIRYLI